jgi:hypothetical protein
VNVCSGQPSRFGAWLKGGSPTTTGTLISSWGITRTPTMSRWLLGQQGQTGIILAALDQKARHVVTLSAMRFYLLRNSGGIVSS